MNKYSFKLIGKKQQNHQQSTTKDSWQTIIFGS